MNVRVGIIIVSDRVSAGTAKDKTGPSLVDLIHQQNDWNVVTCVTVADDVEMIQKAICVMTDNVDQDQSNLDLSHGHHATVDLVLTAGGTGFGVRDVTPEAVRGILLKEASGLATAMLVSSLAITNMAALSRPICGIRNRSIIITLPGSPKGAIENLTAIIKTLPHAIDLARGEPSAGETAHIAMHGGHQIATHDINESNLAEKVDPIRHDHFKHHNCSRFDHLTPHAQTCSKDLKSNIINQPVTRRARISPFEIIPFETALDLVLNNASSAANMNKQLVMTRPVNTDSIGYVLAEDVMANENVPMYRASIVDGYAVMAADGPGEYPVIGSTTASQTTLSGSGLTPLKRGAVSRITTGAEIPPNADAVVMVECTELISMTEDSKEEKIVKLLQGVQIGQDIREIGSDIIKGSCILSKGCIIMCGELGVLTSCGIQHIKVYRRPIVSIMSSGNELIDAEADGTEKAAGYVRDSNRPTLHALLKHHGFDVVDLGIACDTHDGLATCLRQGMDQSDVIVSTGGVSMGEMDLLKPILERDLGADVLFGRVALKPGKPTTFAVLDVPQSTRTCSSRRLFFALPGNPVSTMVTFYLFVLPALRKMAGYASPNLPRIKVKLGHDIHLDPRPEFFRAKLEHSEGMFTAFGTGIQRSSRMQSMTCANALLVLPALSDFIAASASNTDGNIKAGSIVEAIIIGDFE
ncbi:hypothetical protein QVD99_001055 [Batrachochytrium dendrobatidis]|nr:hypothetical protein O5D80_002512 [Batrachochytrium dendrobatidis]KAK5673618.1 hypothetical protein QVD99_001055 [Batrachochytrium dendrobatidis]